MEIKSILQKAGKDWSDAESAAVFEWIMQSEMLDRFVQFGYALTQNLALAEDVVLSKMLDAYRYRHTYDPAKYRGQNDPFINWLYHLIARAARKESRKIEDQAERQKLGQVILEERRFVEASGAWKQAGNPAERERIDKLMARRLLKDSVDKLTPIYREALHLVYEEEMSIAAAAKIAGCKVNAMKVRVCRACQELRRISGENNKGGKL